MWSLGDAFDVFNGEGTLFGAITKVGFAGIDVVVPRAEIADAFERLAARWDEQIEVLEKNARTLAATRDALLPQLLSGAIRLRQAEKLVEEVV
jgi:type I restriction enzyme S subunit